MAGAMVSIGKVTQVVFTSDRRFFPQEAIAGMTFNPPVFDASWRFEFGSSFQRRATVSGVFVCGVRIGHVGRGMSDRNRQCGSDRHEKRSQALAPGPLYG